MHKSSSDTSKDSYAHEKSHSYKPDRRSVRRHDWSHSRNSKSAAGYQKSVRYASPSPDNAHRSTSSDDKKGRVQESRKDDLKKPTPDSECGTGHSSKEGHSRDHRRHRTSDRHIRKSDTKEEKKSSSSHSSKDRKNERLPKDNQRKVDRRQEDSSRKYKSDTSSDLRRQSIEESAKESHQAKVMDCRKERKEKAQDPLKTSCEEPSATQKTSLEENSPNRKLCFMETLNLTISPIKKPTSVIKAHQDSAQEGDVEAVEKQQEQDESYQPTMEDMCVVDEVNCSILEPEQDDVMAKSPDTTEILQSEKKEGGESGKEAQKKDGSCMELSLVQPVKATSANRRTIDITLYKAGVPIKSKSPANLKPTDLELSRTCDDKTNVVLKNKLDPVEAKNCVSRSPSEELKSNVVAKVKPGKDVKQAIAVAKPSEVGSSVSPKCTQPAKVAPKSCPKSSQKEDKAAESVGSKNKCSPNVTVTPLESGNGQCSSVSCLAKDKDVDAVSSTISLDSLPQEGLSLPEAIYILTQTSEEANDGCKQSSSTGSVAVPKVSSTTSEAAAVPQKLADLSLTPKKSSASVKTQGSHFETPSPLALLHDEDSMMRTLSGLKRIPDAISPLRSPIQTPKRSHHHSVHTKPGHVKSLERGIVRAYNCDV